MQFAGKEVKAGTDKPGDALVTLELSRDEGINLELVSKASRKYGAGIREAAEKVLKTYDVKGAQLLIEDFGALNFVISARVETALVRAIRRSAE